MSLNLDAFNEDSKKKSKSKYKAALGVGSVVGLFGIGSTLAANISLNGGGNVEFGQGVATTAACDEDGFSITPVTVFNNEFSIFMVDYVQVSGLDLTPEGKNWFTSGDVFDKNGSGTTDIADAKLLYPGQYYDTIASDWKRTCDGVVLDFKAYTDDINYINRTVYDYGELSDGNLSRPIGWAQDNYGEDTSINTGNWSPGFAVVIDISDAGNDFDSNYAGDSVTGDPSNFDGTFADFYFEMGDYSSPANSTFTFAIDNSNGDEERPDAASISKITVQSMAEFPSSYYARYEGLGNPDLFMYGL
jgi:hypothetical protein